MLLIAEAANPEWVSVPLVGWSHARALLDEVDAHLVTQVRNSDAIARAGLVEGEDFTAIDSEVVAAPMHRVMSFIRKVTGLGWQFDTAMQAIPYYYFEHRLWKLFGKRIKAGEWDVVHRLTPLSPTIPSRLAARCKRAGVPFVWGPINGGVPWPKGFEDVLRREGEWLTYVRNAYKLMPGYASTQRDSACIVAGSIATQSQLAPEARERSVYIPENAIDEARFGTPRSGPVSSPLSVAFVGRFVPYKGLDMLIEASADLVRAGKLKLDLIGDGPERPAVLAQIEALGLGDGIAAEGWVEHRDLQARLLRSDVLGFPSVREFGGGVVLEAMSLGLVPVVADYAGPAELVTESTGFKIPFESREQLVAGTRAALEHLVAHPEQIRPMGEQARNRVLEKFTWPAKARQMVEVYRWVTGQGERPDVGTPFAN
ncbi:glycosyltransferase family 4 protein [Mangrovimicrobium sediminis]|uniref:glycosyltransferase family 4 protein n=1 Tax=Mangrovimicrobium sediminis TaxID=2562682 RepID=UPI00197F132E|nr:glycosyltransferase family 4 protein [Haliea sp. SAOS-164]